MKFYFSCPFCCIWDCLTTAWQKAWKEISVREPLKGWSVKGNAGEKHKWKRTVKCVEGKLHGRAVEGEKDGESPRTSVSDCQTVWYVKEEKKIWCKLMTDNIIQGVEQMKRNSSLCSLLWNDFKILCLVLPVCKMGTVIVTLWKWI